MGLDIMFYETDNQNFVKEYLDYLDYLDKDWNAEFAEVVNEMKPTKYYHLVFSW